MAEDILIHDESADKKYFTVIPNMIVNGYNAVESGVYLYIKRKAGENGTYWEGSSDVSKKLGIRKSSYLNILRKFEKEGTIKQVGVKPCKTHPVREYAIIDIWKRNQNQYKKIGHLGNLSPLKEKDSSVREPMIGSRLGTAKKNLYKKNQYTPLIFSPKYSSLKEIQEKDLVEISQHYRIPLAFVKLCLEKMTNWLEAKGKTYKNYKRGLMGWVLRDAQDKFERRANDNKRGIDAEEILRKMGCSR